MISRTFARAFLVSSVALSALAVPAAAQDITSPNSASGEEKDNQIIITGSRIKQDPTKSSLPLTIISSADIERNNLTNPEQLNMFLTSNGTGADNLASNADVTTGAQRGTNGLSSANLRGQGSAATLVLLNGRRVAAHGLSGGAVDVNQIPFAAIERVEVLKDGASAIYGTDAIGGVINYITKKNYTGLGMQGMVDVTEAGGGNIYRLSGIAGYGDLDDQGFNVMAAVSYSWNQILRGSQRDFVNGNQPLRGTFDILLQTFTIMGRNLARYELKDADVVIRPQVGNVGATDFTARHDAILEGERAALAVLPQIREALKKAGNGGKN